LEEISINQLDPGFKFQVAKRLGGESIKACFACGACTGVCPVKGVNDDFDPRKIIHMVLLGMKDQILSSDVIWYCIQCRNCSFICPQNVKFSEVMGVLRDMAIEANYVHPSFKEIVEKVDRFSLELRGEMLSEVLNKKAEAVEINLKELAKSSI